MRFVVDRIEGEVAVLEGPDGFRDVVLAELPDGIREGDVLEWVEEEGAGGPRPGRSGTGAGTWRVVVPEEGADPYAGLKTDDGDVKL